MFIIIYLFYVFYFLKTKSYLINFADLPRLSRMLHCVKMCLLFTK